MDRFQNREEAGKLLAETLPSYARRTDALVLALPRGGVPVAYQIARALHLPLDVFIVRKLGVPGHEELAMGAIAGGVRILNDSVIQDMGISDAALDRVTSEEQQELMRREIAYRGQRAPLDVTHKTVILVDDGVATGATLRAAVTALRQLQPNIIVVAVPVAEAGMAEKLKLIADKVICLSKPADFYAVGAHYVEFEQTTDDEVKSLLALNKKERKL